MDIPILLYHHLISGGSPDPQTYEITISQFERQLDLLVRRGFETIGFRRLFQILESPEPPPRRIVIITFDDGYRSFLEFGLPALQRRRLTATVFVPAGEIGGTNHWDRARGFPERRLMTEQELREIAAAGIEIGAHGWAHRALSRGSESEAREEVLRSREHLRALGFDADVYSYPYGDHLAKYVPLLQQGGYRGAVSIFSDERRVTSNRFAMRRVYIHPADSPLRFRLKLSQLYLRYKAFRGMSAQPDWND